MAVPIITSLSTAKVVRFTAFQYQIIASGTPTSYAATGLPAGLSINTTTGLISGTTTVVSDDYVIVLTATNGDGTSNPFNLTLTVYAPPPQPTFIQNWCENNYLYWIMCSLRQIAGDPSGEGRPIVPGTLTGANTTPVVLPAGANAFSLVVGTGSTVTPSGTGTEFDGSALGEGTYSWSSPSPAYTYPEITFTGDSGSAFTVTFQHL